LAAMLISAGLVTVTGMLVAQARKNRGTHNIIKTKIYLRMDASLLLMR
jgi:hypothetical protein